MKLVIFGATGMIGHGALLEALDSDEVEHVLSVGRKKAEVEHAKLEQIEHADFEDFFAIAHRFSDRDGCLWCLGTSSAGMDEATYRRITVDFTLAAARVMVAQNPSMHVCFLSGAGARTDGKGAMWARVKGEAETAVQALGFAGVTVFRPASIKPLRGAKPRGAMMKITYGLTNVFDPLIRMAGLGTSTVEVGRAMVAAVAGRSDATILDSAAINVLAAKPASS